jgi:hypothetical protein
MAVFCKKMADYLWKYEGLANYKEKSTITSATPIHIASVSKVITVYCIEISRREKKYI